MKGKKAILSVTALICIFILYGTVLGDGGPFPAPPGAPSPLPSPNAGPFLQGTFTAAYDQTGNDYHIHVILERMEEKKSWFGCKPTPKESAEKRLFYFMMPADSNRHLYKYENDELKKKYEYAPYGHKVGEAFKLKGIPVLAELSVVTKEPYADPKKGMIYGTLKIRVVPEGIPK
jgi:hypothetical protein